MTIYGYGMVNHYSSGAVDRRKHEWSHVLLLSDIHRANPICVQLIVYARKLIKQCKLYNTIYFPCKGECVQRCHLKLQYPTQ